MPPPPPRRLVSRRLPGRPPDPLERRLRRGSSPSTRLPLRAPVGVEEQLADSLHDVLPIILAAGDDSFTFARQIFRKPSTPTVGSPFASMTSPAIVDATAATPRSRKQRARSSSIGVNARRRRRRPCVTIPRGCHDSFTVAVRWPSRTGSRAASGSPPDRQGDRDHPLAAARRCRRSSTLCSTGCLRDILRPSSRIATAHPHRASVGHQGSSAVRLPDTFQDRRHACGASFTSRIRRRQELLTAPPPGHLPDHPRGPRRPVRLARPLPMTRACVFRPPSGPPSVHPRVRVLTGVTATSSV